MKNLKRTLSLVLAVAMCFSLLTLGASAKTYTDASTVTYTAAVQWLTTLNVLGGEQNSDGTYTLRPTDPITRAEFAKLVCSVLNGGNTPSLGTTTETTFTDTKGHWAAGYIEILASLGYIAGYGDGTFGPDDTITGQQAAKILLTVLGYDSSYEGLVGNTWSFKADTLANTNGLYYGLKNFTTTNLLKREEAAQIIWNALNDKTIIYTYSNGILSGKASKTDTTLLSQYFEVTTVEGVIVKNSWGDLTSEAAATTFNSDGTYSATSSPLDDKVVVVPVSDFANGVLTSAISFNTDYTTADMLGESVVFAYKTASGAVGSSADKELVGDMVVTSYNKSYTTTAAGKIKAATIDQKLDMYYDNNATANINSYDTKIVFNYALLSKEAAQAATSKMIAYDSANSYYYFTAGHGWTTQFIDYDGDGTCDFIKVLAPTPYKVTSKDSSTYTVKNLATSVSNTYDATKLYNLSDLSAATVSIGDIILGYLDGNNKMYIMPTTSFTGSVTGIKTSSSGYTLTVDGTAYTILDRGVKADGCATGAATKINSTVKIDTQATFYKDSQNNIVYIDETSGGTLSTSIKFALMTYVDGYSFSAEGQYIQMIKSDGTVTTALVKQAYSASDSGLADITSTWGLNGTGTTGTGTPAIKSLASTEYRLIAYTTASDGSLKVYDMGTSDLSGTTLAGLKLDNDYARITKISDSSAYLAKFTSSNTSYTLLDATDSSSLTATSYTGYSNVPTVTFTATSPASTMFYVTQQDAFDAQSKILGGSAGSYSSYYIMYIFTVDASTSANAVTYFYIPSATSYTQAYNGNGDLVNTYTAFVDGVSSTIDILSSKVSTTVPTSKYLYKLDSYDSDGKTIKTYSEVAKLYETGTKTTTLTGQVSFIDNSSITVTDYTAAPDTVNTYILTSSTVYIDMTAASGHEFIDHDAILENYVAYVTYDTDTNEALQVYICAKGTTALGTPD